MLRPTRRTKTGWARNFGWNDVASPASRLALHREQQATLRAIHDLHRIRDARDLGFYAYGDVSLAELGARCGPCCTALAAGVGLPAGPNLPAGASGSRPNPST